MTESLPSNIPKEIQEFGQVPGRFSFDKADKAESSQLETVNEAAQRILKQSPPDKSPSLSKSSKSESAADPEARLRTIKTVRESLNSGFRERVKSYKSFGDSVLLFFGRTKGVLSDQEMIMYKTIIDLGKQEKELEKQIKGKGKGPQSEIESQTEAAPSAPPSMLKSKTATTQAAKFRGESPPLPETSTPAKPQAPAAAPAATPDATSAPQRRGVRAYRDQGGTPLPYAKETPAPPSHASPPSPPATKEGAPAAKSPSLADGFQQGALAKQNLQKSDRAKEGAAIQGDLAHQELEHSGELLRQMGGDKAAIIKNREKLEADRQARLEKAVEKREADRAASKEKNKGLDKFKKELSSQRTEGPTYAERMKRGDFAPKSKDTPAPPPTAPPPAAAPTDTDVPKPPKKWPWQK